MWHDPASNMLVYDPLPAVGAALVERGQGAVKLHNGYVALPNSLYNLQLLTWLGQKTLQPMAGYDWPRRLDLIKQPFYAQRVAANFMALHPRCFNLSDMGVGKTMAALWAADFIMRQVTVGRFRCLIVAPLSTLQRVWADAIFNHLLGRRSCVVLHGTPEQRIKLLAEDHDFYITNFDGLAVGAPAKRLEEGRSFFAALEQRADITMAIVDEASAYRDPGTRRHLVARRLVASHPYLWMMTGTPTPNGPVDAYGLAKLVNNAHGETLTSYRDRVMMKISQFKWVPRAGAMTEARKLLQPAVRFAIEDCMDLPPCTTQQREVEFSPEQAKAYNAMKRDLQVTIKGGRAVTAVNEAVLRMKLIQISCGAVYGPDREVNRIDAAPRINALREVLEQTTSKIVVFAPLTSVLHMLSKELSDWSREIVNGSVSLKDRGDIFTRFLKEEHPRILLCDPATMSHGINELVAAQVIVWYAPVDRTELYLQANKRIDRPGQGKPTTIIQLASTPIEREIYRRLAANEGLQGAMLNMVKETRG